MDRVEILAQFVDLLNEKGAEAPAVHEFCEKYANDAELKKLFRTAVQVQVQLRTGNFGLLPGDQSSRKTG